jgi:mechanosensitive ion channel-like protein
MNGITYNQIPNFGLVIWTIIIGIAIAGAYIILKKIFLSSMAAGQTKQKWLGRMEYGEKLFWPVFIVSIGTSLIISQVIVGLALSLFLVTLLWKTINNYFLGLVYMAGSTYTVGQRIRYNNQQGTIRAFNNLTLEMELEDGESLDIPYSFFADTTIIRTSPQSGVLSHTMKLPVAKPCDLEIEKQRIKSMLLALPWVLPSQKIVFEHLEDEEDHFLIKVTIQGIDKNHMYKVENKIKSMYLKIA